ncbi:MAG: hypothetical protein GIKADHBN_00814 [Phycisphaerales bacterium]|nr:hypothetical protein [Phycisphaerales bacterium]
MVVVPVFMGRTIAGVRHPGQSAEHRRRKRGKNTGPRVDGPALRSVETDGQAAWRMAQHSPVVGTKAPVWPVVFTEPPKGNAGTP